MRTTADSDKYMGGSADRRYNLSFIVENSVKQGTPLVAVSLNYRLSVFGFPGGKEALDAGATNLGFRDQRLALHWVNENIASFGGAADKVVIFGESSGAESVAGQVLAYNGKLTPFGCEIYFATDIIKDATTASSEARLRSPASEGSSPAWSAASIPLPTRPTTTSSSATSPLVPPPSALRSR